MNAFLTGGVGRGKARRLDDPDAVAAARGESPWRMAGVRGQAGEGP
jgi:hypothetical protein